MNCEFTNNKSNLHHFQQTSELHQQPVTRYYLQIPLEELPTIRKRTKLAHGCLCLTIFLIKFSSSNYSNAIWRRCFFHGEILIQISLPQRDVICENRSYFSRYQPRPLAPSFLRRYLACQNQSCLSNYQPRPQPPYITC